MHKNKLVVIFPTRRIGVVLLAKTLQSATYQRGQQRDGFVGQRLFSSL